MGSINPGIAMALAWPETPCKQAGAWYDGLMNWLGVSENHFYKVGHSAVILINPEEEKCHYFDFGRYHAPFGYGRVRSEETDHDLKIKTKPRLDHACRLLNKMEIIAELQNNPSCHGKGGIFAGICQVDYEKSYQIAQHLQDKGSISYGPFIPNGTNCSRFVRSVIMAGAQETYLKFKLIVPYTLSPTPMGIVKTIDNENIAKEYSPYAGGIFAQFFLP